MLRNGEQVGTAACKRACMGHTTDASTVRDRQGNRPTEDIQIREVDRRREQTRTPAGERGRGGMGL